MLDITNFELLFLYSIVVMPLLSQVHISNQLNIDSRVGYINSIFPCLGNVLLVYIGLPRLCCRLILRVTALSDDRLTTAVRSIRVIDDLQHTRKKQKAVI